MNWRAALAARLSQEKGLASWQLACWILTHPPGLVSPSLAERAWFAHTFGQSPLAVMLIVTCDLRFYAEFSACVSPLPGAGRVRLTAPLAVSFEPGFVQLARSERRKMERHFRERVQELPTPAPAAAWPWDLPPELWPEGDPAFFAGHPWLPGAWLAAWRQALTALTEEDLLAYLHCFLTGDADRQRVDPAAFELDEIAHFFDNETMAVWAAVCLRERLRTLARERGWLRHRSPFGLRT
jgi:hypothetical protein